MAELPIPVCVLEFYLGVTRCPDGVAKGAYYLRTRGQGVLVTVWPNYQNQLPPLRWNHIRGVPMWNQEMTVLQSQLSPEIATGMQKLAVEQHWAKLMRALEEIPIEEAIEDDEPKEIFLKKQADRRRIWREKHRSSEYSSVFCSQDEHQRCKQIDCDCFCHEQTTCVGQAPIPSGQCTKSESVEDNEQRGKQQ